MSLALALTSQNLGLHRAICEMVRRQMIGMRMRNERPLRPPAWIDVEAQLIQPQVAVEADSGRASIFDVQCQNM